MFHSKNPSFDIYSLFDLSAEKSFGGPQTSRLSVYADTLRSVSSFDKLNAPEY